jgi:hypothetical protein
VQVAAIVRSAGRQGVPEPRAAPLPSQRGRGSWTSRVRCRVVGLLPNRRSRALWSARRWGAVRGSGRPRQRSRRASISLGGARRRGRRPRLRSSRAPCGRAAPDPRDDELVPRGHKVKACVGTSLRLHHHLQRLLRVLRPRGWRDCLGVEVGAGVRPRPLRWQSSRLNRHAGRYRFGRIASVRPGPAHARLRRARGREACGLNSPHSAIFRGAGEPD